MLCIAAFFYWSLQRGPLIRNPLRDMWLGAVFPCNGRYKLCVFMQAYALRGEKQAGGVLLLTGPARARGGDFSARVAGDGCAHRDRGKPQCNN